MLKGKFVQLKAPSRENLPKYAEWLSDPELRKYLSINVSYPVTIAEEDDWYESTLKSENSRQFAIHALEDDRLLGNVEINRIDWKNQSGMVGIFIGEKESWGKGYGTDAMRLCLYLGFQELNLQRIELGVFAYNERAIKSYKKLGFVQEGIRRNFIYRDGKFHDDVIMSILRDEYKARYQKEDEEKWLDF